MRLLLGFCLAVFFSLSLQAQGIEFYGGTWKEALAEAKAQEKIIFIDAYASWCGPCKKMSKNVFTDDKIGNFYNKNFVNMKLDMEQGEGLIFRRQYPVSAFPTLFFIDAEGKVVKKVQGAKQVGAFLALGKEVLSLNDRSGEYAEAYEKGDRDPELVYKYVKALNRAGKPSLRIVNEYLRNNKNAKDQNSLMIIYEGTTQADSRVFTILTQNKNAIETLVGKQAYLDKVEEASAATVQKAIEYKSRDLLEEAQEKMHTHYPAEGLAFQLRAEMDYCLQHGESDKYLSACKEYLKKVANDEPAEFDRQATVISNNFRSSNKALKMAESYAKIAAEKGEKHQYYYTYASVMYRNGKKEQAIEAAKKALELAYAANSKAAARMIEIMIEKMKAS